MSIPFHSHLRATQHDPMKNENQDALKVGDPPSSPLKAWCVLSGLQPSHESLTSGRDLGKAYGDLPKQLYFLLFFESFSVAEFLSGTLDLKFISAIY